MRRRAGRSEMIRGAEAIKPLLLFSPWFGPWPEWINFFVESCRWNPSIDWVIHTDQDPPDNRAPNVLFEKIDLSSFTRLLRERLGLKPDNIAAYKLCDFKPTYGLVFEERLAGYKWFGYCDMDVIFGQVDDFVAKSHSSNFDVVSADPDMLAGHLTIFRNKPAAKRYFARIRRWRSRLEEAGYTGMDEGAFTSALHPRRWHLWKRVRAPRVLFDNLAATPGGPRCMPDGTPIPLHWEWHNGKLTHARRPEGATYLHLMRWKSDRWNGPKDPAPWPHLQRIVQIDWREAASEGFSISPEGIRPRDGTASGSGEVMETAQLSG